MRLVDDLSALGRFWAQPELLAVNRLSARASLVPFPDVESARAGGPSDSPWYRSLDGRWRFLLVDRPSAAPTGWADPGHDDHEWAQIDVPGCWTMQGPEPRRGRRPLAPDQRFDRPIYTNI